MLDGSRTAARPGDSEGLGDHWLSASRVSAESRTAHPDVPWPEIVGLRNRIVHAYFDVDLAVVWNIVRNSVPALITALERIAPPEAE